MTIPGSRWLLLHGTPLTPAVWDDVACELRAAGALDVVVPRLTARVDDPRPQTTLARELVRTIGADGPPVHVVGHSFGGQVAIELALLAPELTASVAIVCSRDRPFPAFAAAAAALRDGEPVDPDQAIARWFTGAELAGDGPVVRYARDTIAAADVPVWAATLDAIATYDRSADTPSITAPTTLIAAGLDGVATPLAMTGLRERVPGSRLTVLADAAHLSPFTQPKALAAALATPPQRAVRQTRSLHQWARPAHRT